MDDQQKIVISQKRGGRKREDEVLQRGELSMFNEKIAALVGPTYVGAFVLGGFYGAT